MINLFNLFPIGSMDGGRVANALSPWLGAGGVAFGGYLAFQGVIHNPIFYLILLGGAYTSAARLFKWSDLPEYYYDIPRSKQASIGGAYVALVVTFMMLMRQNNKKRKSAQQLEHEQVYGGGTWKPSEDDEYWSSMYGDDGHQTSGVFFWEQEDGGDDESGEI